MANVESTYVLDMDPFLSPLRKGVAELESFRDKLNELSNDPFKEATKGAGALEKELTDNTKKVVELEAVTTQYKEEVKQLTSELARQKKEMKSLADASKYKQMEGQVKALKEEIKKLNGELRNTSKTTSALSRIKGGLLGAITGNLTGGGAGTQAVSGILGAINPVLGVTAALLGSVATRAFEATGKWQSYSVALKSSLGSQQLANTNLSVLEELAVKLPITLNEATQAFQILVNRGFKPTKDEINNLSGFAAANNKTIDQLIQAIVDAEEGELIRLKEFGIQARTEGDKVSITFRGITKTFEKGARESTAAFADLARELGSDKLNADKMLTLEGRMSNLSDQSDRVSRKFGELLLPVFEAVLNVVSKTLGVIDSAITGWTDFDKVLAKTGNTASVNTYPTLQKLFNLFKSDSQEGFSIKERFFLMQAGLEKVLVTAEATAAVLSNLFNPQQIAVSMGLWRQGIDNINKTTKRYFLDQRRSRRRGSTEGDFEYDPNSPGGNTGPTADEIKLMEKRARELAKLEEKLKDELLKIENEYGKEKLDALKDNELEYIEAKRKYDQARIDQEQQALLKLKQLVSGARRGMYDRNGKVIADQSATLSGAETAPFDFRRQLVDDQASKERAEFINKAEKQITELLSNEFQKQLQEIEYRYEKEIELARKAGIDIVKIQKQKEKEVAKVLSDKGIADLEKQALQEQTDAERNIIRAQIEGRTDLELEARAGLLEIEKKYQLAKIKLIEASGDEESEARIAAIKKVIDQIDLEISEIADKQKDQKGIGKYLQSQLGMSDDKIDETLEAAELFSSKMQSIMSDLYSTLNRLSENRIQRINDEISKKEDQVRTEEELNKEGVANNLSLRLKELADLKDARERALEDQKRLQRTQMIVETATQASSMITAASKVYSGFAGIPIVGVGLGIAAVALMLGAFAAAKIKAFQLVNQQPAQFGEGGDVGGNLHRDGGTLIEAEKGEYVVNRRATSEHHDLIEAINNNDRGGIMDYLLKDLLDGTGVTMNDMQRREGIKLMTEFRKSNDNQKNEVVEKLEELKKELEMIKAATGRLPRKFLLPIGNNKIYEKDILSGSWSINDVSDFIKK
jgi:hypothetical protein